MEEYSIRLPILGILQWHLTPGRTPDSSSRKYEAGPLGVPLVALAKRKRQAYRTWVPELAGPGHTRGSVTRSGAQRPNETPPLYQPWIEDKWHLCVVGR